MNDTEAWASGSWQVRQGGTDEFVRRWTEFLTWTRDTQPAFVWARLVRDASDDHHFTSFAAWRDRAAVDRWQEDADFGPHLDACRDLCDEFRGGTFLAAAAIGEVDAR